MIWFDLNRFGIYVASVSIEQTYRVSKINKWARAIIHFHLDLDWQHFTTNMFKLHVQITRSNQWFGLFNGTEVAPHFKQTKTFQIDGKYFWREIQLQKCHVDLSGFWMMNLWLNVDYYQTACAFDVRPQMNGAPERNQSIEMSFNSFLINCCVHGYCFRCRICILMYALLRVMPFFLLCELHFMYMNVLATK